jgi:hypothetical protein
MTPSPFTILADSGEAFGVFPNHALAHRWLVRNGLEFEPLRIVRLTSLGRAGWLELPRPLHLLKPERWLSLA